VAKHFRTEDEAWEKAEDRNSARLDGNSDYDEPEQCEDCPCWHVNEGVEHSEKCYPRAMSPAREIAS
jgi:hypothetical protein